MQLNCASDLTPRPIIFWISLTLDFKLFFRLWNYRKLFFFNLKGRPWWSCALQDQDTKIDNRDHPDAGDQDDDHERSQFFGKLAICLFAICYCLTAASCLLIMVMMMILRWRWWWFLNEDWPNWRLAGHSRGDLQTLYWHRHSNSELPFHRFIFLEIKYHSFAILRNMPPSFSL